MSVAATPASSRASFGVIQQIDAGLLNVGYVEAGPVDGPAVVLLHGWPYDIHSYVHVAPLLAGQQELRYAERRPASGTAACPGQLGPGEVAPVGGPPPL